MSVQSQASVSIVRQLTLHQRFLLAASLQKVEWNFLGWVKIMNISMKLKFQCKSQLWDLPVLPALCCNFVWRLTALVLVQEIGLGWHWERWKTTILVLCEGQHVTHHHPQKSVLLSLRFKVLRNLIEEGLHPDDFLVKTAKFISDDGYIYGVSGPECGMA